MFATQITLTLIFFDGIFCGTDQFRASEAVLSNFNGSGLYGYEIALTYVYGQASLTIGAPPSTPQTGQGQLRSCIISAAPNSTFSLQCSAIPQNTSLRTGNIGQSFSANTETGTLLACSPTSPQNCSSIVSFPGYCYLVETHKSPPVWNFIDHTDTTGCSITKTVDVLFVLDGSGSVQESNFLKVKEWVVRVTDKLGVDEQLAKVAVMQFSTNVWMEIELEEYDSLSDLQDAIYKIKFRSGNTNTLDALKRAVNVFKESALFGDPNNNQVMITLTDGQSGQLQNVKSQANILRSMAVTTYSVGVGSQVIKTELQALATGTNTDDRVYEVTDFSKLDSIVDDLQKEIQQFIPNEGAGNLTVELAQAGFDVAFSKKNSSVKSYTYCVSVGGLACV